MNAYFQKFVDIIDDCKTIKAAETAYNLCCDNCRKAIFCHHGVCPVYKALIAKDAAIRAEGKGKVVYSTTKKYNVSLKQIDPNAKAIRAMVKIMDHIVHKGCSKELEEILDEVSVQLMSGNLGAIYRLLTYKKLYIKLAGVFQRNGGVIR